MGNGEWKIVSDNNYNVWECIVIEYLARMGNRDLGVGSIYWYYNYNSR